MKLLLADDHTLFRDALVQYIMRAEPDAQISLAKDIYEAEELMKENPQRDLVLLDLYMPGMSGMKGFRNMRETYPDVPLALMSGMAEEEHVKAAMDMGAAGYFPKTLSGKALLNAIQLVLTGERFVPLDRNSSNILPSYRNDKKRENYQTSSFYNMSGINAPFVSKSERNEAGLTPREIEVLKYLACGLSNKEIARELNLQVVTIKLHVRGVCRKLDAKNRTQAALKAHQLGIVNP